MSHPARVTIGDVAAQAGVSIATVSKVINRRYGVAAETLARVQAVIDELGYESSLVAQSLRSHRTNVIGIVVADIEPFSAELLKGAARAIRGSGYELVVYSGGGLSRSAAGWERRYLSRVSGTLTDGTVLVTPTALSVIGFDNIPESALTEPGLTTIEQPIQDMGYEAVRMLIRMIDGTPEGPVQLTLPTSLVVRQSCGTRGR